MYTVKTEQFEGPLDVLLRMIEDKKMDITRLSLSKVTDQFVEYVESAKDIPLLQLADFLVVTSRLLLIKSRALLPVLVIDEEEEEEIEDLELQLREYKRFKEISEEIRKMYESDLYLFAQEKRISLYQYLPQADPQEYSFSGESLRILFEGVLADIPDPQKLKEKVIRRMISLEERVAHIKKRIFREKRTVFSKYVREAQESDEVAVSFLAVLELVKSQVIESYQETTFGEIIIESVKKT
jgi:segregation and condensation protein A